MKLYDSFIMNKEMSFFSAQYHWILRQIGLTYWISIRSNFSCKIYCPDLHWSFVIESIGLYEKIKLFNHLWSINDLVIPDSAESYQTNTSHSRLIDSKKLCLNKIFLQGMYTCVAKNVVGKAYVAAYLQVARSSYLFLE